MVTEWVYFDVDMEDGEGRMESLGPATMGWFATTNINAS